MQRSLIFLRVRNEVAESALHKLFWWGGLLGNARHSSGPSIVVKNPELACIQDTQKVFHQEVMP